MTLDEARQHRGRRVTYRAAGQLAEDGEIVTVGERYVAVLYDGDRYPKATDPALGQWDRRDRMAVLPYREARDEEDERHIHPLQLDVPRRVVDMRTNPGETVLTPFLGVGTEAYAACELGRRAIGVELKPGYHRQALKNLAALDTVDAQPGLFDDMAGEAS